MADIGSSCKLLAWNIAFPTVCCVGMGSGDGLQKSVTLVISGAHSPAYVELFSSVVIVESFYIQVVFDAHTVLSYEQSVKTLHSNTSSCTSSSAPKQAK